MSINSDTLACIWKAISYCAMRVAISGSSHSAACCLLSALIAAAAAPCRSRVTFNCVGQWQRPQLC
jgi:hypothetical protein